MSPAVIAIVKGGLGNQLFIYAAARALALRTGRVLYLDSTRGYTQDDYGRSYRLNRFPITAEPMPEGWRIAPTLKHPRHKIIRALNKLLPRDQRSYFAERHHTPPTQLTALQPRRERITLLGYWQNEAYFADHAATIRAELAIPAPTDDQNRVLGEKLAAREGENAGGNGKAAARDIGGDGLLDRAPGIGRERADWREARRKRHGLMLRRGGSHRTNCIIRYTTARKGIA